MSVQEDPFEKLTQSEALTVINALQNCVAPSRWSMILTVGRDAEISTFRQQFKGDTGSKPRLFFVRAPYQQGKTRLLNHFSDIALQDNYVESKVTLKPECSSDKGMTLDLVHNYSR